MGIWLLHVLPFSVEQNVPFNLLDDCIARKGIWLFHVQIFCWVRFPFEMTWRLHCMQGNWTYSFSDLLCWTRFLFVVLRKIRIHEVIQSLQYIIIRGAIKKKTTKLWTLSKLPLPPPPLRQVWTQKVWTLRLGSDPPPPPTVVWTFWHKKFEITKSISDKSKSWIFLIGLG